MSNGNERLYLRFVSDLALSGILPKFAALIKAECERTGKSAIEVIDEGLKSGPRAIKMKFLAAMQTNGFTSADANKTVNEFFRRLSDKNVEEEPDDYSRRKGESTPELRGHSHIYGDLEPGIE
ncbi:MAG: hypothetical protein Q7T50_07435 [Candidatus Magasanikbacteria bacterium]|nr:hypothetical protein [Candidatus Magasanikbacteria bacterium]